MIATCQFLHILEVPLRNILTPFNFFLVTPLQASSKDKKLIILLNDFHSVCFNDDC